MAHNTNDVEREVLIQRFARIEDELTDIAAGRVVDGDPAEIEGDLFDEQDAIEFWLGTECFGRRDDV